MALDLPNDRGGGTGFVLAQGTVVTCAHVVAGADTVHGRVAQSGQELTLTLSAEQWHRAANGLDIAFLRFGPERLSPPPPHALTSPHTASGDRLWVFGHPRGDYRAGQWAALEHQGESRLAFDDPMPMLRGYGTPVGEGFSGSPVVDERTGAVCGMLARSNKAGSAHLIPLSEILARHPAPEPPVAWLNALNDNQIRAGGFRHPGPALRDYLRAAREGADEHPYAAILTEAGDVPLSTVYVRQDASRAPDADTEDPRRRHTRRNRPAESVLADHRHVLFTGGAGVGKSSLLRRLTHVCATAWLEEPAQAPPYMPVRVAAAQLTDRPFPEAMATAVGRDLPGLRRSPQPELFDTGPLPNVDWLVCVDGLDEVLDPDERAGVIRLVQRWAREPHLRFVVASRSLVTAEMNRLGALGRYALEGFGDREMGQVATSWFKALGLPEAGRRSDELTVEVRRGRLGEVARNPLYLTMICVVAALPVGHLAGVGFDRAVAEWQGLLARRRPEAVTRLGHLYGLLHAPDTREHVRLQLLGWAQDATAPVEERIAAAERVFAYPRPPWFTLAADPATPPRLRLAICAQLPSAGRHNRIPLARALATDSSLPTKVRAPAAALLAYDLGEEGRRLLQELSAPGRGVAEAHLAVGAAWEELDVGVEAVAAYQRVLKDERADARHRVDAAARLARWREARGTARQALRAVLYGERAPVAARVDAAEHLVAMHEQAEAHLGLLRLTLELPPESAERDRITGMLPADLRTVATRLSNATSAAASA
ncbi:trypsin-like peptidase domain-containing protein [Streptomyces collinus]